MPRRHRGERRRRIRAAVVLVALVATACAGSGRSARGGEATTGPSSTVAPSTAGPRASTTTSTVAPTITSTPVTSVNGAVVGTVTAVTGTGPATVALPAAARPPAIVHAQYTGDAAFVVSSVDARGKHLAVLAQSLGSYDGTFPIGFVDQKSDPTAGVRVDTTGHWHLDIAGPTLAPVLSAPGVSGRGDAVLSYTGPEVGARVTYSGKSDFSISTFTGGVLAVLVSTSGPYSGHITLPAGPAFISVTAAGEWSMSLG